MSISSVASTAVSGLRLAESQVAAEAQNIVNAHTPGYVPVVVDGVSQATGGVGSGVTGMARTNNLDVQSATDASVSGTDYASSFVNMTAAEQAYKASLQVLKASDEMSRELIDVTA